MKHLLPFFFFFFKQSLPLAENLSGGSHQSPLFHRYPKAIVLGQSPLLPPKKKQPLNNNPSKLSLGQFS